MALRGGSLGLRVGSAALLAPLFVGAAYAGGRLWAAVVGTLVVAGSWEYCRLALAGRRGPLVVVVTVGLAATAARYAFPADEVWPAALAALALGGALALGLAAPDASLGARTAMLTLLGALYVGWLLAFLVGLRELPRASAELAYTPAGFVLVASTLAVVWVSDIAAYFTGRAWGGRKLLPRVSPGKTVTGAVGGVVAAGGVSALLFALSPEPLPRLGPAAAFGLGTAASVLAQVGDLAESLLKRAFDVKDSSGLIPGHGGVLDRFDALLFVAPAAYYFFRASLP